MSYLKRKKEVREKQGENGKEAGWQGEKEYHYILEIVSMNYIEPVKNEKSKAKNFLKNSIKF